MKFNDIKIHKPLYTKLLDISDSTYFSREYSNYISNSKLSLINPDEGGSPEKYLDGLSGNKIYSGALEFGSAVHQLVLQPDEFHLVEHIDKPSGKPAFIADYILSNNLDLTDESILLGAKECDYFHGQLTPDKIVKVRESIQPYVEYLYSEESTYDKEAMSPVYLSSYDRYRCLQCLDSLKKNGEVQRLLYPKDYDIYNEATLISQVDVEINGELVSVKFKGKLDNFIVNDEKLVLNDLKTTGHQITEFTNSFAKFHYNRQIGLYLYFLKYAYPNIQDVEANIIAVQTTKPFTSHVFPISLESIQKGLKEAAKLIRMVAFYEYYGYDKTIEDYYE